jgi:DNA-binding MarR family transcriptional regulator
MVPKHRVSEALRIFPKLRFYFPAMDRQEVGTGGVVVTEDGAALLWIIETCCLERGDASQSVVRRMLGLDHDRCSQLLRPFVRAKYVNAERDTTDGRNNRLTLTRSGRSLLHRLTKEHAALVADLLAALTEHEQAACIKVLDTVAEIAWERLQHKAGRFEKKR